MATGSEPISSDNLRAVIQPMNDSTSQLGSRVSALEGSTSQLGSRVSALEGRPSGTVLYDDPQWPKNTVNTTVRLSQSFSNFDWLEVTVADCDRASSTVYMTSCGTTLVPTSAIKSSDRESNGGAYAFTLNVGVGPSSAVYLYGSGTSLSIGDESGHKSIARVVGY